MARTAATGSPDLEIKGQITVNDRNCVVLNEESALIAQPGSFMKDATTANIAGLGEVKIGDEIPVTTGAVSTDNDDPDHQGCGVDSWVWVIPSAVGRR